MMGETTSIGPRCVSALSCALRERTRNRGHVRTTRAAVSILPVTVTLAALLLSTTARGAERHFELTIHNGRLAESAPTLRVSQGDDVVLELSSDRDLELHLHGYSLTFALAAGVPAVWRFAVPSSGRFPLAVHEHGRGHGHATLLYLEVHPG